MSFRQNTCRANTSLSRTLGSASPKTSMKKDKKRGVAAKPGVSPETSRRPLKADLDPDFLEVVRAMDKAERKEIGDLIEAVCKSFGFPHEHKGLRLRDLGHAFYECRIGLQQRVV